MGCNASSAKGPKVMVEIYGVTASMNCMGPILLAQDNGILDLKVTMPGDGTKAPEFLKINPHGTVPALKELAANPADRGKPMQYIGQAGDFTMAESTAILRYIGQSYVVSTYPDNAQTRAYIDWACDRFGTTMYADCVATIYPVMGFVSPPDDKEAAAKKCVDNLESFCSKFLQTKFVGGDELSIADYKVAPFFMAYEHPAIKEKSGVECPDRIKSFNKDFSMKCKSYKMLLESGGFSVKEMIEKASEIKGDVCTGTPFTPTSPPTPAKDLATDGKIEIYGMPASMNSMGAVMMVMYTQLGEMKQCMPGTDTMKEDFLKMNPFHGIPTLKDGDFTVAESSAVLRYMAEKYYPTCYPAGEPKKRAIIDYALDRFATAIYPDVTACIYPIMGFAPEPADKQAAADAATARLEKFADMFLRDKYIGGNQISIADFKVAPFLFAFSNHDVQRISLVKTPRRVSGYCTDFEQSIKPASMLRWAGGFSVKEFIETKIAERKK